MRRDLDALIDDARRAEAPAARDMASAREGLARRIARGEHVELEAEVVAGGGLRAPGFARAGWALLGAAAVAAALLVTRSTPPSKAPMAAVQLAEAQLAEAQRAEASSPRAEGESRRAVSEPATPPELLPQKSSDGVRAGGDALQPLPEPPAPPSRAALGNKVRASAEPPPASPASPAVRQPEAGDPAANNLAAESRALAAVQRALRSGEFERALQLLGEHDRQFARGVLLEERAAARIIASCGAGLGEAARESARAFASRYPNSPLRPRVRASCKDLERELPERGP